MHRLRSNLLVIAGSRLGSDWAAVVGESASGRARLFTNCHAPPVGPIEAAAVLLTGLLPGPHDRWDDLYRVAVPHLGHYLAGSHYRVAVLEGAAASADQRAPSAFAQGFDEVIALSGGPPASDALLVAAERTAAAPLPGDRPWFIFVCLSGTAPAQDGLDKLLQSLPRHGTTLVVFDTAETRPGATGLTPLWVERPGRSEVGGVVPAIRPIFCSPLDLLPTLLGVSPPPHPAARDLTAKHNALRPSLLSVTLGSGEPIDDEAAAALQLRLAGARQGPAETGPFVPITFVVAVDDDAELENNLLRSPLARGPAHQWLLVDNAGGRYSSISNLYEDTQAAANNNIIVFCHQDVFLPEGWDARFLAAISQLERLDPHWGVLGSVGMVVRPPGAVLTPRARSSHLRGHWADPRGYRYAGPLPHPVECLDEMWLALRKNSGLHFDRGLPGFHCYGIDLSLTGRQLGLHSYAIEAFAWHKHRNGAGKVITAPEQSHRIGRRVTEGFKQGYAESYEYVARKWAHLRPFASTSAEWPAATPQDSRAPDGGSGQVPTVKGTPRLAATPARMPPPRPKELR